MTFKDGGSISDVSFATDLSAIRIKNPSFFCTPKRVQRILEKAGLPISEDQVVLEKRRGIARRGAVVTFNDPKISAEAWARYRAGKFLRHVELTPAQIPLVRGPNSHRVVFREVRFSWRQQRIACLGYATACGALSLFCRLNTWHYQVDGAPINPLGRPRMEDFQGNGETVRYYTVRFMSSNDTIDLVALDKILIGDAPKIFRWEKPEEGAPGDVPSSLATSIKGLKMTLDSEFGPMERFETSARPGGEYFQVCASFTLDSHALSAAAFFNGRGLSWLDPSLPSRTISAKVLIAVTFDLAPTVYKVVESRIMAQKGICKDEGISLSIIVSSQVTLKLEGHDRTVMAQAQKRLRSILDGTVIKGNGKNIWHPAFVKNKYAITRIREIEDDLGVAIIRDVSSSQLRLVGDTDMDGRVVGCKLSQLIKEIRSRRAGYTLPLSKDADLPWLENGGAHELSSRLGESIVSKGSAPSFCLSIRGPETDFDKARALLASKDSAPHHPATCAICLCPPEDPIRTSCYHAYCTDCFISMCKAEASMAWEFCITCKGDAGCCNEALHLADIREYLPPETYEGVLEASFGSHVRRHAKEFRHCPTPGCTMIYRVNHDKVGVSAIFTCPECLQSTCTFCHVGHFEGFCPRSPEDTLDALKNTKRRLGIKDCPECTTSIEKVGGCETVRCGACGCYICWRCTMTFRSEPECGSHVYKTHAAMPARRWRSWWPHR